MRVKDYVAGKIGGEHIIPTLAKYKSIDEIDLSALPDKFVLKCNHDSGSVFICRNKHAFKKDECLFLEKRLKYNYYRNAREWPYKNIKDKYIIAEPFIESYDDLPDYKFFCFDGKPTYMFIATGRHSSGQGGPYFDFFDMDFNHLDILNGHSNAPLMPSKPESWNKMKELATILSQGIKQVRIDFYEVKGQILFGEYTFCHWEGFVPFNPREWDIVFGRQYKIPSTLR